MRHLFYAALAAWFAIAFTACSEYKRCKVSYMMPDLAICKTKETNDNTISAKFYTFRDCDNGWEYFNPKGWKRLESCAVD